MDFIRSMPQPGTQRTSSQAATAASLKDSTEQKSLMKPYYITKGS